MFRFENPEILYFLLIIPVLVLIFIFSNVNKKKRLKKFGDINIINVLIPDYSKSRPILKFIFLTLSITFLILGLANPQIGSKLEQVKRKGIELMIALDVSNSMMAEDIQPNRLERAKQAISKLIDNLENDRIGLIIFAGDAFIQLPITTDYTSAKMFLNSINTGSVPVQGTSIGKAIELGMRSFSTEDDKNKAIIIITDGENHEDNGTDAANNAYKKGITVHTIGMGLPQGAPIPVIGRYGQRDFKTDKNGEVVISKLNETMLQQIASAGNGIYIRANNTTVGLSTLFDELNKLEKKEIEGEIYSEYDDRFQYFLAISLFFLILEILIIERKNKLFRNVKLFKVNN